MKTQTDVLYETLQRMQMILALLDGKAKAPDPPVRVRELVEETISELAKSLITKGWPEPTVDLPDWETLEQWLWEDGGCEATDGCWTDPDGLCPHGHPSWLLKLGLI